MEKHKGPMPESVKNFWRVVVKGEVTGDGEDFIDKWEGLTDSESEVSYQGCFDGNL